MKRNLWIFSLVVLFFLLVLMGKRVQYFFLLFQNSACGDAKVYQHPVVQNKSFVILFISYGDIPKTKESLRSIFEQNYRNLRILYVNQNGAPLASIQEFIEQHHQQHRISFLKEAPGGQELQNIYNAVVSCQDHEIVILMREGDFLAHHWVLFSLNQVYANPDIWISYGKHLHFPNYFPSTEEPFKMSEIVKKKQRKRNSFDFGLKSFYAALFKKVSMQDFLDEGGFYFSVEDFALMMPMIEMAAAHVAYLSEIHYLEQSVKECSQEKKVIETFLKPFYLNMLRKAEPFSVLDRPLFEEERKEMDADLLIFSEQPEHLVKTLESIEEKLADIREVFVVIPQQKRAFFEKVKEKYAQIFFIEESARNLKHLLIRQILLRSSARFFLCTTDQYFLERKVDLKECMVLLALTKARGFYLGLGEDASFCFRGRFAQELPRHFLSLGGKVKAWECHECECGDWAFPDGFVMALYEKDFLKRNIELLNFQNIEELERNWSLLNQERRVGLCYKKSMIGKFQDSSGFIKGK